MYTSHHLQPTNAELTETTTTKSLLVSLSVWRKKRVAVTQKKRNTENVCADRHRSMKRTNAKQKINRNDK